MDINSIAHHPSGRTHGVSAIIIKSTVEHYELPSFDSDYFQATIEAIEDWHSPITLFAVYCSPKHILSKDSFDHFFGSLRRRFIAGDDINAIHNREAESSLQEVGIS